MRADPWGNHMRFTEFPLSGGKSVQHFLSSSVALREAGKCSSAAGKCFAE
jgi:hypothetical protein